VTEKFRQAVKDMTEREHVPLYPFNHQERKDDIANDFRRKRGIRNGVVFVGVAQEKAQAFQGKKIDGQFWFTRDKTVYVNRYYFYIDDADFGPLFLKVCRYAPWSTKLCLNGHEWANANWRSRGSLMRPWTMVSYRAPSRNGCSRSAIHWDRRTSIGCLTFRNPKDFDVNKGLSNLPYLQKIGREINRRLPEEERVSHNSGLSGDSIQRVVQPTVTENGEQALALKFGQPRVMALLLALTLFQHT
jgi:hypothetical protein